MGELFQLTNTIVDTMKHINYHGVSMWNIMQIIIWFNVVVWTLVRFFFGRVGGGSDD